MSDSLLPPELELLFTMENATRVLWAIAFLLVGYASLKVAVFFVGRVLARRMSQQSSMLVKKTLLYGGMLLLFIIVLGQFGVRMNALLGAAGVFGIGLGIAAQTSLSNVVSGVFLLSEKTFAVGDLISIGDKTGVILSIDLLSVKLRTLDNQFVRVPNEHIIKNLVTNITRFPIRRMDMDFTLTHGVDLARVQETLRTVAVSVAACLDEPEPYFMICGVNPLGCEVRFGVWFPKDQFIEVRNGLYGELLKRFADEGIEIAKYPFVNEPKIT